MKQDDFLKLTHLFALQAQLNQSAMPKPAGMVMRRSEYPDATDFERCDFLTVPLNLLAVNLGTDMNAMFNSLSLEKDNSILIDELRIPMPQVEKIHKLLMTQNTPVAGWNSLMMRTAMAFADLPEGRAGVPDIAVEGFMAGAGLKPIGLIGQPS